MDSTYRFVTVENYFADCHRWQTLGAVQKCSFSKTHKSISLSFEKNDGSTCAMLIQIASQNTVRFRFSPSKADAKAFRGNNSRSIIMDSFEELVDTMEKFTLEWEDEGAEPVLTVLNLQKTPVMRLKLSLKPFRFTLYKLKDGVEYEMLQSQGVYFTPHGEADHNIVLSFKKPPNAKYIGFGEHGGVELSKNSAQLNFFNFDNMRYRQVYNRGPLECREPLYHTDPFFMQFNTHAEKDFVGGFFVDNPSQILMDMGFLHANRWMVGTRFWDADVFFIAADDATDVMKTFMSFIGTPKLKPRYALGYHQGCYGWDSRQDVEYVVNEYRKHRIPLDGIHIDVDIQKQYQTFTIDENKFPLPKEMFANLKARGIQCSTNITPVISNKDFNYKTYAEGEHNGHFLKDRRTHHEDFNAHRCQDFGGGHEYYQWADDREGNYNSGRSYIGEVYYGTGPDGVDRGTTGHYANLNDKKVRRWWGKQYEYLFECGLEMVWQDMTTPCLRSTRGDMRGLPFRLLVTQDYYSGLDSSEVEALKVWNLYSYNLHKATYHGLNHLPGRENKRNFIVGRGSFTGMHRFAALWTGDNSSNWEFLRINVAQILSLGMSGQAMGGQDIGGFEREHDWEQWADPELLIRWTAAGALMPWFRNHYIGEKKGMKLFQEPYAYNYVDLNYWNVPQEVRHFYRATLPVCRHYIELRYRLMQLFYDALFENTINGMPICRPMFLCCSGDKALYNDKLAFLSNQFFVRNDLLVAPILDKQAADNGHGKRDIYLPDGSNWYAYMDNKFPLGPAVEGGTTVRDYDAYISDEPWHLPFILPMYVREGAILPTLEVEQYIGERNRNGQPNPITLNIYPGAQGEYTLYLDDGQSRSSAIVSPADPMGKAEYREVRVAHRQKGGGLREISLERLHDGYRPMETFYYIAVLHAPEEGELPVVTVKLDGEVLPYIHDEAPEKAAQLLQDSHTSAWYYHPGLRIGFMKVFDEKPKHLIELKYK
jgi:alpha-glucosidase